MTTLRPSYHCPIALPHSAAEVKKCRNVTMPTVIAPPVDCVTSSLAVETANYVNNICNTVDKTHCKVLTLEERLGSFENEVKDIKANGVLMHDACMRTKKFPELQPRIPTPDDKNKALIQQLKEKLQVANVQLVQKRNEIHKLREEARLCVRLVKEEVGQEIDLNDPSLKFKNFGGWKGRAQVISCLRSRVAVLEHQLQVLQHNLRHNETNESYDPTRRCNPEYYVPDYQRNTIDKIYQDKNKQLQNRDEELIDLRKKCKKLDVACRSLTARNDTLTGNLKDSRGKLKNLEKKSSEDNELIRTLIIHQNTLKDILERQTILNEQASIRQQDLHELFTSSIRGDTSKDEIDMECEKYRTLWQASENATTNLEYMVDQLQRRLDMTTLHVVEAEKHCCQHQKRLLEMEAEFEELRRSGTVHVNKLRTMKSGQKIAKLMVIEEELKTKKEENDLLRTFLEKLLKTKASDFNLYKTSLEMAKREYLLSLQNIKESLTHGEAEEEEEEEEDEDKGPDE